jgi:hypothetical protein
MILLKELPMRMIESWALALLLAGPVPLAGAAQPPTDDPCAGFKWDVRHERALFATAGATLPAGKDGASASNVLPDHLYRAMLLPASQVEFPVTPGKSFSGEGTYAGIFSLSVPAPGKYRIAIDSAFWIDVAGGGKLLAASDYEGQHDCTAPRKIVEFVLTGKGPWILQLSGASQAAVRVTITAASAG